MESELAKAKKLWSELGNIPVNDDGETEEQFLDFEAGTHCEEIWSWFEETFDVRVYDLMFFSRELDPELEKWVKADENYGPGMDKDWYEGTLDTLLNRYEIQTNENYPGTRLSIIHKLQKAK